MVGPRVYSFYSCTSSSENLSRLGSGTATVPEIAELGFSERVSQLIQAAAAAAAASRTPLGLGGEAGRRCSRFDMTLGSVEGHESNKYSWISWWQLLTVSCFKKYYQIIIMNRVLCFEINDFFFLSLLLYQPSGRRRQGAAQTNRRQSSQRQRRLPMENSSRSLSLKVVLYEWVMV